ncbi:MAG: type II toxin-antitoxin system HipA family toxin [Bacteroidales bacterium]|jgi:serine/threonine-protein kinase HipA|nr:type II toxin-antitoxin system HipA family toxin [Bacteroidales bacterium]
MLVEIILHGQLLGTAEWNAEKQSSTFQYNNEIVKVIEPSPILMPTEERIFETNRDHINFHNLPYLLSDSMPDDFGNAMMKEWLKQRDLSIDDINPVDRLTYVGKRGMGALEYIPANHREDDNSLVDISEIYDVAKSVLESKKETSFSDLDKDSLTEILRIGTSVGGARAKALIAIKRDQNKKIEEIRSGDIMQPKGYSYWLLKIDGANKQSLGESEGMGKIEFAYYELAKEAGIEISESTLHEENGRFHFLTKRFDRTDNGEKIHMQTLSTLAGIDYKIQKASSYETLFRVMKRLQLPYKQYEQQYRRMLFNVVSRNHDDHVKNFSFLMNKDGNWQISPAYDICFSYSPSGTWTNVHQSSINGKYDNFTKDDLLAFAKIFGIKKANKIIEEVVSAVNQWPKIASEIDIPQEKIKYINKYLRTKDFY